MGGKEMRGEYAEWAHYNRVNHHFDLSCGYPEPVLCCMRWKAK